MKVRLLFGDSALSVLTATWQNKTFSDEMTALEFIRKHKDKIIGINGNFVDVSTMSHFQIMDLLKEGYN